MRYIIDNDMHIHSNVSICSTDPEQTPDSILKHAVLRLQRAAAVAFISEVTLTTSRLLRSLLKYSTALSVR